MGYLKKMSSSDRRKQILEKATALFSKYGFEKMTISRLANECRITEPALYRYFSSKKNLYEEVLKSLKKRVNVGDLGILVEERLAQ